jgi:hypothetical protein
MSDIDTSGWTPIGGTSRCDCFLLAPRIAVMVPKAGMRDTAETAREQMQWQEDYWKGAGHTGCFVIIMDTIVDQDAGAREVYAQKHTGQLTVGYALIGGTFWGRAISTAYMALNRPKIPTRFFATVDQALPWLAECLRISDGTP